MFRSQANKLLYRWTNITKLPRKLPASYALRKFITRSANKWHLSSLCRRDRQVEITKTKQFGGCIDPKEKLKEDIQIYAIRDNLYFLTTLWTVGNPRYVEVCMIFSFSFLAYLKRKLALIIGQVSIPITCFPIS